MTIDFYYVMASPFCRTVLLVGRAVGVKFNLIETSVLNKDNLKPEFIKINPQHTIPTIVDKGFCLWESRAILGYLADKYSKNDKLYPKDPKKRAVVNQRLFFDLGTLFPRLTKYMEAIGTGQTPDPDTVEKLEEAFKNLETFLEGQDWLVGKHITIADYAIAVTISFTEYRKIDISKYPNIVNWFARAKKTIDGYDEIQTAGFEELTKLMSQIEAHYAKK